MYAESDECSFEWSIHLACFIQHVMDVCNAFNLHNVTYLHLKVGNIAEWNLHVVRLCEEVKETDHQIMTWKQKINVFFPG